MKSFYLSVLVIIGVLVLGACGNTEEAEVVSETPETQQTAEENETAAEAEAEQTAVIDGLEETDEDTLCEYCQMTVYDATHELGAFTAQGIKADGSNAFFDDIGCMLNQERVDDEEMEKFVRDYESLEWIPFEQAVIVKSGLKTPMNYGFAFFKDQAAAEAFIAEQGDAELSDFAAVDVMSHERHEMRMEKMGEGNSQDSHGHSDPEEGTDKMEHGDEDGMKDDGE